MNAFAQKWALGLLGLTLLSLVATLGFAARLGFLVSEQRADRAIMAEGQTRIDALRTPAAPVGARPFVGGSPVTQSNRVGETFNVELSKLGLTVEGVETSVRRPFSESLDSISMTIRGRGDAAAGLKALAWLNGSSDAIAIEKVTAYPADKGQAQWTFNVIVLATRGRHPG